MNKENAWRFTLLGALLSLLPFAIVFQMFRLQTNPEQVKAFKDQGDRYDGQYKIVQPARGEIFDRWGNLLAANKTVYEVGVELPQVENMDTIETVLGLVLGLGPDKVKEMIYEGQQVGLMRVVIADDVTQDKVQLLDDFKTKMESERLKSKDKNPASLSGVVPIPHLVRSYPERELASNILGFVNRDNQGNFGVEEKYNNLLAGKTRSVWVPSDPNQVEEMPNTTSGTSLILTIDREIQKSVESVLDQAIKESGSDSGVIVVEDPRTGELLAIATTPRMDLNNTAQYLQRFSTGMAYNAAVNATYEPGSVFKVLTMASALDDGAVKPDTPFLDTGVFEIGGIYIYNWNSGAWGPQDMLGCMQHSLNVCLAWVASQMGAKDFYRYMQAFSIGHLTGVDMAGEVPGRLKMPGDADWFDSDLGTNAFGQGVAVTPVQLAAAISAVANDGKMMAPHVVRSMVSKGYQYDIEQRVMGQPIKAETARTLTDMLARSLEVESSDALVTGYRVAGKTGTAEIPTPFGYTSSQTNASFVGWGPADDPRFLVYVWLEKPTVSPWGSVVASPVFRQVVENLVVLMNIPPDDVRHQLRGQ